MVVIYGEPMGKQRPKFSSFGGFTKTYTPTKTTNYETLVKYEYARQDGTHHQGKGIILVLKAYYGIPKSFSKKKREMALHGKIRPKKKPDLDNIEKIICDALNKIAYDDDCQIICVLKAKWYDEVPRVEFKLKEVEEYE